MRVFTVGSFNSRAFLWRCEVVAQSGHEIFFVAPGLEQIPSHSFQTIAIRRWPKPFKTIGEMIEFRRIFSKVNPDIVHIHFAGGVYGALSCLFSRVPIVVSVMGGDVLFDEQPHQTCASQKMTLTILQCASAFTCKSYFLCKRLVALGFSGKKMIRTLWGLDVTALQKNVDRDSIRRRYQIQAGDRVVLSPRVAGSLYNTKRVIEAFSETLKRIPNAKLICVAGTPDEGVAEPYKQLVSDLGISKNVTLLPFVEQKEMNELLRVADVMISIPSSDGIPQSLFEAMICGVPSVLSRLDRYEEVVTHGKEVLFVDQNDIQDVANALETLLSSEDLWRSLAEQGKTQAKLLLDQNSDAKAVSQLYDEAKAHQVRVHFFLKLKLVVWICLHFMERALRRLW